MYALEGLVPHVADTRAGTTITFKGQGFLNTSEVQCAFLLKSGAYHEVNATFLNKTALTCVAGEGSDDACLGRQVHVRMFRNQQLSANDVRLIRSPSARAPPPPFVAVAFRQGLVPRAQAIA